MFSTASPSLDNRDGNLAVFALGCHTSDEVERLFGISLGSTSTERDVELAL